ASKALVPDEIANSIAQIPSEDEKLAALKRFNCLYQKLLNYYKCIDWYDVVWLAVKLLRENSDVLREESSQIDYLLVDEYQDLNRADHTLIQLLSTHSKCLMVFGDDDQSIYETARFANPSGVKKFSDTYKSAKIYSLSVCWRCGAQIIDAAWGLIDRNLSDRMPKEKPLSSPERGEGEVIIIPLKSKKREIEYLCDELQRELRKEQPSESILVLFHSKRIGREYADALIRNGLRIENLLDSREEHSEALLLLYETLRFIISDGCDNLSARFLLEKWFKKSKDWIAEVRTQSIRENRPLWKMATEKMGKKGQLNSWEGKFKEWKQMVNSSKMLQSIIEFLGINEREEIKNILAQCEQDSNINLQSLLDCIEKGADVERQKAEAPNGDGDKSDVILMSMHGAKGLSADVVFIPALEDELMPNNWNESEQRRLLYVSMTRAKKRLIMSWAWSRRGKEIRRSANSSPIRRRRSRFLDDIEERVENYGKYQNSQS
ncbi:MAG: ATP-dependent helicase, partial [candidate division WOR-3 bacterium]